MSALMLDEKDFDSKKSYDKEAVRQTKLELLEMLGDDVKVDLNLDQVITEKNEYTVSARVRGLPKFIYVSKTGHGIHESLFKIKKAIVRQVRSFLDKRRSLRRRNRP